MGTCIIGSLAATSYWGPVGGHGVVSHDLNMVSVLRLRASTLLTHDPAIQIRAERKQRQPEKEGLVPGPVQALPAPEDADKYVVVKKKDAEKKEEKQ